MFTIGQVVYENLYDDGGIRAGTNIALTKDNGYIVAGYNNPSNSLFGDRTCLLKLDSLGMVEWVNFYDDGYSSQAKSVLQCYDDGFIVTGRQSNPLNSSSDLFILKTNNVGGFEWSQLIGDTLDEIGYNIKQIPSDSGFLAVGGANDVNPLMVRFDKNGDTLWTKTFSDTAVFTSLELTSDNGFVMAGTRKIGASQNHGFVIKTDSFGNEEWSQGFVGGVGVEVYYDLVVFNDDSIAVVGYSQLNSAPPKVDAIIRILDKFGNLAYYQTYGGVEDDYFNGVTLSPDGEFVMAGTTWYSIPDGENAIYVVKTDKFADLIWEEGFGDFNGLQYGYGICTASDGGYVICGQKTNSTSQLYLIKVNESGSTVSTIEIPPFNDFNIYPNPMTEFANLSFEKPLNEDARLYVHALNGQLVFSDNLHSGADTYQLHRSELNSGLYLVTLETGIFKFTRRLVIH